MCFVDSNTGQLPGWAGLLQRLASPFPPLVSTAWHTASPFHILNPITWSNCSKFTSLNGAGCRGPFYTYHSLDLFASGVFLKSRSASKCKPWVYKNHLSIFGWLCLDSTSKYSVATGGVCRSILPRILRVNRGLFTEIPVMVGRGVDSRLLNDLRVFPVAGPLLTTGGNITSTSWLRS